MTKTGVEIDLIKSLSEMGNAEFQVLLYEFKDGLNSYLKSTNGKTKSLEDVIAFDAVNEKTAMPHKRP